MREGVVRACLPKAAMHGQGWLAHSTTTQAPKHDCRRRNARARTSRLVGEAEGSSGTRHRRAQLVTAGTEASLCVDNRVVCGFCSLMACLGATLSVLTRRGYSALTARTRHFRGQCPGSSHRRCHPKTGMSCYVLFGTAHGKYLEV